jgi:hypothetical protein
MPAGVSVEEVRVLSAVEQLSSVGDNLEGVRVTETSLAVTDEAMPRDRWEHRQAAIEAPRHSYRNGELLPGVMALDSGELLLPRERDSADHWATAAGTYHYP